MSNIPPAPEPQGSQPSYQPPTQGSSTPAPEYSQPSGYAAAPPAAYPSDGGAKPKGSNRLGLIAFIVALAAVIIGSILAFIGGQSLGTLVEYTGTSGAAVDPESIPADAQAAGATGALLTAVGFIIFAVLGLWGFIQGIVAAVKNRGRGWGIAAIILAVIGGGIVGALWFAGFTAGAGPYLTS